MRLSVVLEARAEAEVVAIRNGEVVPGRLAGRGFSAPVNSLSAFEIVSKKATHAKVQGAAREATSRDAGYIDETRGENGRVHERLSESEEFDALLSRPWRDCIEAICADLGLSPDWSAGLEDDGFAPPGPGPLSDRPRKATCSPDAADVRQSGPVHRTMSAEPAIAAPGQGPP